MVLSSHAGGREQTHLKNRKYFCVDYLERNHARILLIHLNSHFLCNMIVALTQVCSIACQCVAKSLSLKLHRSFGLKAAGLALWGAVLQVSIPQPQRGPCEVFHRAGVLGDIHD